MDNIFKKRENEKEIDSVRKENNEANNKLEPLKKVSFHKRIVNWIKKVFNINLLNIFYNRFISINNIHSMYFTTIIIISLIT